MKNFKKNYIGKGTKNATLDIVKISLKVEDILSFKHTYEGTDYITFEVARLQTPDKYGHTHTAYVTTKEEVPEAENETPSSETPAPDGPAPTPKARAKKTAAKPDSKEPF